MADTVVMETKTKETIMKNYECTCPVCRKAHTVQAGFLSSPRSLLSTDGRILPAHTCGAHPREQLVAARYDV